MSDVLVWFDGAIRAAVETKQPNRDDLLYGAEGRTTVCLQGALGRAASTPAFAQAGRA
jgi:hypothetical protein